MKLSEKIYNKKDFRAVKGIFGSPPGYEASDVEVFLDEIVVEVERMEKELEDMRLRTQKMVEDQQIEEKVLHLEGNEELTELKEKLKRVIEQHETITRAQRVLLTEAEAVGYKMKEDAMKKAQEIEEEARANANSLMKKVEERCAEKEAELQRLQSEEERFLNQFGEMAKMIQTAVKKN